MASFLVNNNPTANASELLWRIIGGAASGNIELNTTNGATGINASYPANTKVKQLLTTLLGIDFAGSGIINGGDLFVNGVGDNGGTNVILIRGQSGSDVVSVQGVPTQLGLGVNDGTNEAETTYSSTQQATVVSDGTDELEFLLLNDMLQITIRQSGSDVATFVFDATSLLLNDGTNTTFEILNNGIIKSNQITAGAPVLPTHNLIVQDFAGNTYQIPCELVP